jgi:DNA topoisomerase IB
MRDYVGQLDGGGFLTKDLRTNRANLVALEEIRQAEAPKNEKEYKRAVKAVAEKVSKILGNRPAQALESYINPAVFASWRAGLTS